MATMTVQDSVLLERIAKGDEGALADLYDRYAGMLYAMLLRILKDTGAAEEILQDLFLHVWRRSRQFDVSRGSLMRWLLVIGRSRALSRLRVRKRWAVPENPDEFSLEAVPSPKNSEEDAVRTLLVDRLRRALAALPPYQREAMELAYFEGMTQTEIAARTGNPLGTVKSRLRAAIQTLKELFHEGSALPADG
jgi:RNA polymerase sigma-70 factor, ECF subfamily